MIEDGAPRTVEVVYERPVEIIKLSVLAERLDSERVREIVNRPSARDAFDLIEAVTRGDSAACLAICQSLAAQGEAPPRVLGALTWQYHLVARCVGLAESRAIIDAGFVAQTLKVRPFVAKKALAISKRLFKLTANSLKLRAKKIWLL